MYREFDRQWRFDLLFKQNRYPLAGKLIDSGRIFAVLVVEKVDSVTTTQAQDIGQVVTGLFGKVKGETRLQTGIDVQPGYSHGGFLALRRV
jgi:hypothetical protein